MGVDFNISAVEYADFISASKLVGPPLSLACPLPSGKSSLYVFNE